MQLNECSVTVDIGDVALQEYDLKQEGNKESACFVASEEGKTFSLEVRNSSEHDFDCRVRMDGIKMGGYSVYSRSNRRIQGIHVNSSQFRSFVFQSLQLTDNDSAIRPSQAMLDRLGTIQVDIFRGKRNGTQSEYIPPRLENLDNDTAIHEKSKKAGTHCVRLGDIKPCGHIGLSSEWDYIDPLRGDPFSRFTFRYRPQAILQAQGIMPLGMGLARGREEGRPGPDDAGPSKSGRRRSRDEEEEGRNVRAKLEADSDELNSLLAEQAALEARICEARARNIKREPSPIILGSAKGEVIDLTDE